MLTFQPCFIGAWMPNKYHEQSLWEVVVHFILIFIGFRFFLAPQGALKSMMEEPVDLHLIS